MTGSQTKVNLFLTAVVAKIRDVHGASLTKISAEDAKLPTQDAIREVMDQYNRGGGAGKVGGACWGRVTGAGGRDPGADR